MKLFQNEKNLLKGYEALKQNKFKNILHLRSLIEEKFEVKKNIFIFSHLIKNIDYEDFLKNIKSNFIYENLNYNFNKKLLLSLTGKKFDFAMPTELNLLIKNENYTVSIFNNIFWKFFLIKNIVKQYLKVIYKIRLILKEDYRDTQIKSEPGIYIKNYDYLNKNYWDTINKTYENNISWILNKFDTSILFTDSTKKNEIKFNRKSIYVRELHIFKFVKFINLLKFIILLHYKFLLCFFLIFSPLWYFAFNFFKIIEVDGFHINSEKNNLNKLKCFFDNIYMFDQPLWVLSKNIKKKNVYVYFTSSNFELIYLSSQEQIPYSGYRSLNWNNFLIWDKRQEEILKKAITSNKNLSFSIVGPIPSFNISKKRTNKKKIDLSNNKTNLILFDVSPYRFSRFIYLGMPNEYYTYPNVKKFYDDIIRNVDANKCEIFFKKKRSSINLDKNYSNFLERLKTEKKNKRNSS